jgi:hypothetical protein
VTFVVGIVLLFFGAILAYLVIHGDADQLWSDISRSGSSSAKTTSVVA